MPKKKTTEEFIRDARAIHGDKYDYSEAIYHGADSKICVICPEHGKFWPTPNNHLRGSVCPQCVGRTVTTSKFIEKARNIHGDKYDYSQVNYINSSTPVTIICPKHGEFQLKPSSHLQGNGCSKCSGNIRLSTERFISKARALYGGKYNYSKVQIIGNNKTKVCIICPIHGEFWQSPNNHLRGAECPSCFGTPKKTTEKFIEEAKIIHGDKYDYSKVEYKGGKEKVCIICPEHGEFWQAANAHLKGSKCPICSRWQRVDGELFKKRGAKVHHNKFDYSKVNYVNRLEKVCIICPEHGEFWQKPEIHLRGYGCPICGGSKRLTTEEFIEKANIVHNNKYIYEKTHYINTGTKVCITCPEHGDFWQTPNNHLFGAGCPKCAGKYNDLVFFLERARKVHGEKYDYSKAEYKGSNIKLCIVCPEHGEFWQTPSAHMHGQGCPICSGRYMDTSLFIERSIKVHNGKYDYSLVDYKGALEKVKIICPYHGVFEQVASVHLWGSGCPICNQSHLEKEVMRLLKSQKIRFEYQKSFEWLTFKGKMHLDFFLPEQGIAIECQGEQHFYPCDYFGGNSSFKVTRSRDELKNKLCEEHGIMIVYYTNLDFVYHYPLIKDTSTLLKVIENRGIVDSSVLWEDPKLPLVFDD